MIGRAERK